MNIALRGRIMDYVIVLLVILIIGALVYATWWKYDAEHENQEAAEEVARLQAELDGLKRDVAINIELRDRLRAERARLSKMLEELGGDD